MQQVISACGKQGGGLARRGRTQAKGNSGLIVGIGRLTALDERAISGAMQLDHIFCFIEPEGPQIAALECAGLKVSYRRTHPGQGTANACFVFENAFVELLWCTSESEARSPAIARTRLWERSLWRGHSTCPFGIAWRGQAKGIETWDYTPPYLPSGMAIPVATDSLDPCLPMLFQSPGNAAPTAWPPERHGGFQHAGGWTRIAGLELSLPIGTAASPALRAITATLEPPLRVKDGAEHSLRLQLQRGDGSSRWLTLPNLGWDQLQHH
jgi:Glyoxalase-like domain